MAMQQSMYFEPEPDSSNLRDYQVRAIETVKKRMLRGERRVMLCAPTGAGKTIIALDIAKRTVAKGNEVWFIADRQNLVDQTKRAFENHVKIGILMGQEKRDFFAPVQICSMQTLCRREIVPPSSALIVVDEAHTQYRHMNRCLQQHPGMAIGLSATPMTKGLGSVWQSCIMVDTTNTLIRDKWLIEPAIFTAHGAGDIVGDIPYTWVEKTKAVFGDRKPKTIIFGNSIAHCREIASGFSAIGIETCSLSRTADDPDIDREKMIARFNDQNDPLIGLISVDILTKGFDSPVAECLVIARKLTKSLASHIQMLGRVMRPSKETGKTKALVLDHASNSLGFGGRVAEFWANGIEYLPGGEKKKRKKTAAEYKKYDVPPCRECGFKTITWSPNCPQCGAPRRNRRHVATVPGKLHRLGREPSLAHLSDMEIWKSVAAMAKDRVNPPYYTRSRADTWARVQFSQLRGRWMFQSATSSRTTDTPLPEVKRAVGRRQKIWRKSRGAA